MAKIIKGDIVFLHIPKTGGNWLTKVLKEESAILADIGHKHATYDFICGYIQNMHASYLNVIPKFRKFRHVRNLSNMHYVTIIRNPLKWYESWFKYQTARDDVYWGAKGDPFKWHVMSSLNGCYAPELNEFMNRVNKREPGFVTKLYSKYVSDSGAYILKNETLREDICAFSDEFGLGFDKPRIMSAERHGVSPEINISWDRTVFKETVELERSTLEYFNYDTEASLIRNSPTIK